MTEAEIRARQQELRDAGFAVKIDGKMDPGGETETAWGKLQARRAAESKAAAAAAAAARAQAEVANERLRIEVQAKEAQAKLEAAERKEKREVAEKQASFEREQKRAAAKEAREFRESLTKLGINATALGAGVYGGIKYASHIDNRRSQAVEKGARALGELGKEAKRLVNQYARRGTNTQAIAKQLAGIVAAADKAKFTTRPAVGVGAAAALLAEGALARFVVAEKFDNEAAKEAFQALGTASFVAATTIIGKGLTYTASPAKPVNAKALAAVEAARVIAKSEAKAIAKPMPVQPTVAVKSNAARGVIGTLGKIGASVARKLPILAPIAVGATVASGIASQVKAAQPRKNETDLQKFLRQNEARSQATFDAIDTLTMGLAGAAKAGLKWAMGDSKAKPQSRAARAKAQRAVINQASAKLTKRRQALAAGRKSDGYIDAHARRQGNKLIQIDARRMTAKEIAARMR